jgi:hypothetical protein
MNITLPRLRFQLSLTPVTGFAVQAVLIFGLAAVIQAAELRSTAKETTPFELSLESETWQPLESKGPEPQSFFHGVKSPRKCLDYARGGRVGV